MSADTMARKRLIDGRTKDEEPREELIAVRCTASYKRWVVAFAKKLRTNPTLLVDQALFQLAKQHGFEEPPER